LKFFSRFVFIAVVTILNVRTELVNEENNRFCIMCTINKRFN